MIVEIIIDLEKIMQYDNEYTSLSIWTIMITNIFRCGSYKSEIVISTAFIIKCTCDSDILMEDRI